ncbi:aspartic peptidase domain-containing protein [Zychaea mexicana]|uniref:aspartic peptidase domain-containing protein n=1 Tax=Zychaea mexicana TaxID=64656 RepID=UPI0022FE4477|nr:aspartic peptidase domain-containing protein [Zychaea mexicana]KAI9499151.1 aspartic peptidase domain-containing protein [Zychaea mexicana]
MSLGRRPRRPALSIGVVVTLLLLFIAPSLVVGAAALPSATPNSESQFLRLPLKGTTRPLGLARRSKQHLVSRQKPVWVPGLYDYEITVPPIPVSIGISLREFLLLFDTGSSDTWVYLLIAVQKMVYVTSTELYNPTNSSTYASTNYDFSITYGSGSADGVYFADTVLISNATLPKQILGGVHTMAGILIQQTGFDPVTIDGLSSAAFPAITVMYADSAKWTGFVVFDGYDCTLVDTSEDMVFTDMIPKVPRGSSDERNLTFPQQQQFLIDTGTNYIIIPEADADKLVSALIPDAVKDDLSHLVNVMAVTQKTQSPSSSLDKAILALSLLRRA